VGNMVCGGGGGIVVNIVSNKSQISVKWSICSSFKASPKWGLLSLTVLVVTLSQIFIIFVILQFCYILIVNFSYMFDEKTQETQTAKQLKLQDDSVFATSVPLSDNTACAAFTSTPEHAHQKPNITLVSSRL